MHSPCLTINGTRACGFGVGSSTEIYERGSDVELRGFEPLTPSLRTRCATNCATAPWWTKGYQSENYSLAARASRTAAVASSAAT